MLEIQQLTGFNSVGKNKRKKQIVLTHTSRNVSDYISSLKNRYNGKYDKTPHFIIQKDGRVFQMIDPSFYSNILDSEQQNKTSIVICLENLGWLKKNPLNSSYVNWIGDIYKVYTKESGVDTFFGNLTQTHKWKVYLNLVCIYVKCSLYLRPV